MDKEQLIDNNRDINVVANWWIDTYDDFIEQCRLAGLWIESWNMQFSGFWSQGDGACFSMAGHNLLTMVESALKWLTEEWPQYAGKGEDGADTGGPIIEALHTYASGLYDALGVLLLNADMKTKLACIDARVSAGGHYCHSSTMTFTIDGYPYEKEIEPLRTETLEGLIQPLMRGLADALYSALEAEHEYQTSDDAVWATIEANGLDKDLDDEDADETIETTEEPTSCTA